MQSRGKGSSTISQYVQGLQYFYAMLDVRSAGNDSFTHIGVLQALYSEGVIQELMALKIMKPDYSWTRKIVFALEHLADFCLVECQRKRFLEAYRCVSLLKADVLDSHKKQVEWGVLIKLL